MLSKWYRNGASTNWVKLACVGSPRAAPRFHSPRCDNSQLQISRVLRQQGSVCFAKNVTIDLVEELVYKSFAPIVGCEPYALTLESTMAQRCSLVINNGSFMARKAVGLRCFILWEYGVFAF